MLSIILTWVGAILGIAVLFAMACGAFVLDFDDARNSGRKRKPDVPETPPLRTDTV
ncbi:hypothetical protein [Prauserella muralis]|uniref:hypothetical protein n=1 Tax=Prauserella muralis TaxID=588067 RepID=UPI0011AC7E4B|nr:hypothetical protein [Prauserella muralis]TWE13783.1 hypothetical protein FHX69_5911 [Prauserella muralis]